MVFTVKEVAEYLKVSEKTVRDWITSGELEAHKLKRQYRVTRDQLDKFLQNQK